MRSDAARNRTAILDAARRLMVERGPDVAMDDIARAAGVAVGTLYRHFPTKTDLVAAAMEDSVAQIADEVEAAVAAVADGAAPSQAVGELFRTVAERHSVDRSIKAAARGIGVPVPSVDGSVEGSVDGSADSAATARARTGLLALLDAAAGSFAAPTSLLDMMVLLDGVPEATLGTAARERYVDLVLRGLFATGR